MIIGKRHGIACFLQPAVRAVRGKPRAQNRVAARRAHHDAFGANRGAWRNPAEGGGLRAAWRGRVGESVCGICVGRVPRV